MASCPDCGETENFTREKIRNGPLSGEVVEECGECGYSNL